MQNRIEAVEAGGVADRLGIRAGDELLSINGEYVRDYIDYQALCCAKKLRLLLRRDGEKRECACTKDEYAPLGLSFGHQLMSGARNSLNDCV